MNLVEKIKILTGRKLSKDQMERAEERVSPSDLLHLELDKLLTCQPILKLDGIHREGEIYVREFFEYRFGTTPDASHGWNRPHTGYYLTKREVRRFDSEGNLTEKETWKLPINAIYYPR